MSKQSFESLLEKYLAGQCTPAEKRLVEQWYELVGKEADTAQTEAEWQATKMQMWAEIRRFIIPTQFVIPTQEESKSRDIGRWKETGHSRFNVGRWKKPLFIIHNSSFITTIAASVLIVLGVSYWSLRRKSADNQIVKTEKAGRIEWKNSTEAATVVKLSDGSRVRLQPRATLSFPEVFADSAREIMLTGDAFFDVVPDPNRPFVVRVGNVVTRVLGTSFWVLNRANKRVEVEVKTGKVAVFERAPKDVSNNGVLLTPNHKVTYFADDQHFVTGLVEKPELIEAAQVPPAQFKFENTPLAEVIATLEKGYGIPIELTNEALKNCTLTGDLQTLEMYDKLRVICQSLEASYDVRGTSILISGKGCQ
jgi:hypothetical protein